MNTKTVILKAVVLQPRHAEIIYALLHRVTFKDALSLVNRPIAATLRPTAIDEHLAANPASSQELESSICAACSQLEYQFNANDIMEPLLTSIKI